jgi:ABC-2 type transport system permease protein
MKSHALLPLLWREIEGLFVSSMAYVVLTVFLVLNGFAFTLALDTSGGVVEDTIALFLGDGFLFWISLTMVPALVTMRLVAEERRSGTLEVLLTAPVRDGEVVLAKFLGALVFQAALWAPTLVYIVILRGYGALPEAGKLVSSYVGIACVTSLLTAVGLLCSTRTANQIVAAVASLTFNLLFLLIPVVLEQAHLGPLTRAVSAVSMLEHFRVSFSRGLLDSGILAWYAAATGGVLVIATRSLEARRWR